MLFSVLFSVEDCGISVGESENNEQIRHFSSTFSQKNAYTLSQYSQVKLLPSP